MVKKKEPKENHAMEEKKGGGEEQKEEKRRKKVYSTKAKTERKENIAEELWAKRKVTGMGLPWQHGKRRLGDLLLSM